MPLLVAYGQGDPSAYCFNRHLGHSFTRGFSAVLDFQDLFTWANTTLVSNLDSHHPGTVHPPQDVGQFPPGNNCGSLSTSALQRTNNHRAICFEGETL